MASSTVGCNFSPYCKSKPHFSVPIYNPLILGYSKDQIYSQSNNNGLRWSNTVKRNFVVYANDAPPDSNVQTETPLPSKPSSNSFIDQILRVLMAILSSKLGPLWIFKEKIESEVEKVEMIVNVVENVAEKVDKVTEDITDSLPEGKLKDFLDAVETMAEKTAETADNIGDFIDKVQEIDDQVESLVDSLDGEESPTKAAV